MPLIMDLLSGSAQEAFPPSISSLLLLTMLKISGMDKACAAISCNINLWGWQKIGVYVWRHWGFRGWWVGVKQPWCSASTPKASQA